MKRCCSDCKHSGLSANSKFKFIESCSKDRSYSWGRVLQLNNGQKSLFCIMGQVLNLGLGRKIHTCPIKMFRDLIPPKNVFWFLSQERNIMYFIFLDLKSFLKLLKKYSCYLKRVVRSSNFRSRQEHCSITY